MVKEVIEKVHNWVLELNRDIEGWELSQLLFINDTAVVTDAEMKFYSLVIRFDRICDQMGLPMNVSDESFEKDSGCKNRYKT